MVKTTEKKIVGKRISIRPLQIAEFDVINPTLKSKWLGGNRYTYMKETAIVVRHPIPPQKTIKNVKNTIKRVATGKNPQLIPELVQLLHLFEGRIEHGKAETRGKPQLHVIKSAKFKEINANLKNLEQNLSDNLIKVGVRREFIRLGCVKSNELGAVKEHINDLEANISTNRNKIKTLKKHRKIMLESINQAYLKAET